MSEGKLALLAGICERNLALLAGACERNLALLAGALLVAATILFLCLGYLLLRIIMQGQSRGRILGCGVSLVAQYALLQWLFYKKTHFGETDGGSPGRIFAFALGMQAFIGILCLLFARRLREWDKTHVTEDSIRKGLDALPVGMCYYWTEGLPKLVNGKMAQIMKQLYGERIHDGRLLWQKLSAGEEGVGGKALQAGEQPMFALSEGGVFVFRKRELTIEGHVLCEILATDVTEEQRLAGELQEKCERADDISRRFRELNQTIEKMTIEKEILMTKTRIHNDFGEALTMAGRYLETADSSLMEGLVRSWKKSLYLMSDREDDIGDYNAADHHMVERALEAARELGLSVVILGEAPSEEHLSVLTAAAVRVCTVNARVHGKATELTASFAKDREGCRIRIRNNGSIPIGDLREGGGLGNLRRQVEQLGGTMRTGCEKITPEGAARAVTEKGKDEGNVSTVENKEGMTAEEFFVEILLPWREDPRI